MESLRILIATASPLSAKFGAGQMAINLTEALRAQGHNVTLWSPHPMPNLTRWWQVIQSIQLMRSKLDAFIATQERFDVIDTSAELITKRVAQSGLVVARSVQPQILYMLFDLKHKPETSLKEIILLPFSYLFFITVVFLIIQGWQRSKYILCLGILELEWMNKWFPWWRSKLISYVNALSKADQVELAKIRLNRKKNEGEGIRFLWIGRWVNHKGIDTLLKFISEWESYRPQDTFTIAGCGNNSLANIPLNLIESGKVKILPSFSRNELYNLLDTHEIGLFTSKVEGWGLSINEMLESGMPVFATKAGGVIDLQPFNLNLLQRFPPSLKVISQISQSFHISEEYYHEFSWEKIAEKYEKIAEKCLATNSLKLPKIKNLL